MVTQFSFYDNLLCSICIQIGFVVICAASLCFHLVRIGNMRKETTSKDRSCGYLCWRKIPRDDPQVDAEITRHFRCVISVLYLMYPGTCMNLLRVAFCRTIDGNAYLVDDIANQCYNDHWMPYAIGALTASLFFVLGIPVGSGVCLYRNQDLLQDEDFKGRYGVLYESFRDDCWWGQSVAYLRKFTLIGMVIFISPGSATQTTFAFCAAYFFMMYHMRCAPYCDTVVNRMQMISESTLTLTVFCGLGLQVSAN